MSKKKDPALREALEYFFDKPESLQGEHVEPTMGTQTAHKRPTMEAIRIRISGADLEALDAIADQEGGNRSVLIRRAIRDLLRKAGK